MTYGTTYIVRPFMAPAKRGHTVRSAASGAIQLLVGPASASLVRADERQVLGPRDVRRDSSDARSSWGGSSSFRRRSVPSATIRSSRERASSVLPSHHRTASGLMCSATAWTHAFNPRVSFVIAPKLFGRPRGTGPDIGRGRSKVHAQGRTPGRSPSELPAEAPVAGVT